MSTDVDRRQRHHHPQAVLLTLLALALVAAMAVMGVWQFGAYDDRQRADAEKVLAQPPVPLDDLLGADEAFPSDGVGRPVTVEGRYLPDQQLYVRSGEGYQVVTPLMTATGSAVLVVRGASDRLGPAPPSGRVQVEGVLEPSQASGAALDQRRVTDGLRVSRLVADVPVDLYAGYVVRRGSHPPDPLSVVPPPLPEPSTWAGLRNLMYALQWWVFAAFVVFMWWRIVVRRDDEPEDGPEHERGEEGDDGVG